MLTDAHQTVRAQVRRSAIADLRASAPMLEGRDTVAENLTKEDES